MKRGQSGAASGAGVSVHDVVLPTTKRNSRQVQTPQTTQERHIKRYCPVKSAKSKNVHSRQYRAKSGKHQNLDSDYDEGTDVFIASIDLNGGVTSANYWTL